MKARANRPQAERRLIAAVSFSCRYSCQRPALLFWCFWQDTGKVVDALTDRAGEGVELRRARFTPLGADVPEL